MAIKAEFVIPKDYQWEIDGTMLRVYDQDGELFGFTERWWIVEDPEDTAGPILTEADRGAAGRESAQPGRDQG